MQEKKALPVEFYSRRFQLKEHAYDKGSYRVRNKIFAEIIGRFKPCRVFEFAGAEGGMAEFLLQSNPIEHYFFTDFAPEAVDYARVKLAKFCNCKVGLLDIDKDYDKVNWSFYDTFVSTSIAHLEHDIEIIGCIPKNSKVCLCFPNFDFLGHVRYFKDFEQIEARYGGLMDIKAFVSLQKQSKIARFKRVLNELYLLNFARRFGVLKFPVNVKFLVVAIKR